MAKAPRRGRLIWLDLVRLYCALMIIGIHWLRACQKNGLFGAHDRVNLVNDYETRTAGLGMLPHVLIAGHDAHLATWLTNIVGLLGGFGWEAVMALIVISGFSLTSFSDPGKARESFSGWFAKRAKRVLTPFYLVAGPFLLAYVALLALTAHGSGHLATTMHAKLIGVFNTPLLGIVLSHTLLFNPFAHEWLASFFAPAWWFVPAILVAYLAYPVIVAAIERYGTPRALFLAFTITAWSYYLSRHGVSLVDSSWYFIVLQECFNFTLGIAAGYAWSGNGRAGLERILFGRWSLPAGIALFCMGSMANWSAETQPIASPLFASGIVIALSSVAKRLEKFSFANVFVRVDAYDVYLVHQPFAFPVALACKLIFKSYAVFFGGFAFIATALAAAALLSAAQKFVKAPPWRRPATTYFEPKLGGRERVADRG